MDEEEFWKIADSFRDDSTWRIEGGFWVKDNIWGESSSFGKVYLNDKDQKRYIR